VLTLLLIGTAIWWRRHTETVAPNTIEREPTPGPTPEQRADDIRRVALEACGKAQWRACLDGLNRARELDLQGDGAEVIQDARAAAERGLSPPPAPEPSSEQAPSPIEQQTAPPPINKQTAPPKAPPIQGKKAAPPPVDSLSEAPVPKSNKTIEIEPQQQRVETTGKLEVSTAVEQQIETPPKGKARTPAKEPPRYNLKK
jgi:hypothetical protein